MKSKTFELNNEDLQRWVRDVIIFLGPALIVFLETAPELGIQESFNSFLIIVSGAVIDLLRRYITDFSSQK